MSELNNDVAMKDNNGKRDGDMRTEEDPENHARIMPLLKLKIKKGQ